ncbi:MAG TPA: hypothetical protein VNG13_15600 [Mycobacteriales bacterium]|nr:hypothetical protein [Mycobacteriales bacterium]
MLNVDSSPAEGVTPTAAKGPRPAVESLPRALAESRIPITVYRPGTNLGFAGGHNLLLAEAFTDGATHALVINPDLRLYDGALAALCAADRQLSRPSLLSGALLLQARDAVGKVPSLVDSRGIVWTRSARHLDESHGRPIDEINFTGRLREVAGVTGALMLVPAEIHASLVATTGEFFDGDFFAYREDAELGLRAGILGIASYVVDRPVGVHYRGSPGTSRTRAGVNAFSVRNRFLLAAKYGHRRPGRRLRTLGRDAVVILGVLAVERGSLAGLLDAGRLRRKMREKRRRIEAALRAPPSAIVSQTTK